ncbi:hypothetical protein CFBP5877_04500 [Agrobacterium tumefaciens]|uniref:Uncharacterized protein n=1 Tax=Agrobacterium tumefaciens TaxID=358 RepID=A0AAE6EE85_AGRTU|nr:hypothetical protein CFBP5499_04940 [Agrobacterium tumefaciens]QCL78407.1 hypothetical protein CFBP5877_04500 [Agrobacterium tumefaciens]CUX51169.1 hypothetical protein AGR6A_Cc80488 [Agrobacterium sp. NCPPB 925]
MTAVTKFHQSFKRQSPACHAATLSLLSSTGIERYQDRLANRREAMATITPLQYSCLSAFIRKTLGQL